MFFSIIWQWPTLAEKDVPKSFRLTGQWQRTLTLAKLPQKRACRYSSLPVNNTFTFYSLEFFLVLRQLFFFNTTGLMCKKFDGFVIFSRIKMWPISSSDTSGFLNRAIYLFFEYAGQQQKLLRASFWSLLLTLGSRSFACFRARDQLFFFCRSLHNFKRFNVDWRDLVEVSRQYHNRESVTKFVAENTIDGICEGKYWVEAFQVELISPDGFFPIPQGFIFMFSSHTTQKEKHFAF